MNSYADAEDLDPQVAAYSLNWTHTGNNLQIRPSLAAYGSFTTGVTTANRANVFNGLYNVKFDDGTQRLMILSSAKLYAHTGSTYTDHTASAITSGNDLNPWVCCFGIDSDGFGGTGTFFAANGSNEIIYLNLSDTNDAYPLTSPSASFSYSGGPTAMAPRYCTVFNGRLILGHIHEDGVTHGTRTRASAVNNFLEFDTTAGAQVVDHADTPGDVTGVAHHAGQLLIFKEFAVIVGIDTGDSDTPLIYPTQLRVGCLAGSSFQPVDPWHSIFLGRDNFHILSPEGSEPIGTPIRDEVFPNLNFNRLRQIVSHADYTNGIYRCAFPETGADYATLCAAYNWIERRWWIEDWPTQIHAASYVDFGGGTLIDNLTSTIDSYSSTLISDWGPNTQTPVSLFTTAYASGSDYRLHQFSSRSYDVASTNLDISTRRDSLDMRLNPEGYATLRLVAVSYSCTTASRIRISVSTDKGVSWPRSVTINASAGDHLLAVAKFRATGRLHRVRISTDSDPSESSNPIIIHRAKVGFLPRRNIR